MNDWSEVRIPHEIGPGFQPFGKWNGKVDFRNLGLFEKCMRIEAVNGILSDANFTELALVKGFSLKGFEITDTNFRRVQIPSGVFSSCQIDGLRIFRSRLPDVQFKMCEIKGLEFSEKTEYSRVQFLDSSVRLTVTSGAEAVRLDVKNCDVACLLAGGRGGYFYFANCTGNMFIQKGSHPSRLILKNSKVNFYYFVGEKSTAQAKQILNEINLTGLSRFESDQIRRIECPADGLVNLNRVFEGG
ncbi:MAG: hypothetical protein H6510_01895 [Acidobacteria bacterium]|nr:hypothetical protein [Acidobacteriota bacterium]MCB9396544.1 hypothetical protein [Acidobacteriota bacterium]